MKDVLMTLFFVYCLFVGFFGTLCLGLCSKYEIEEFKLIRGFLENLYCNFNVIGCIIICILILPAILFTLLVELFWKIVTCVVMLFIKIFGKDF